MKKILILANDEMTLYYFRRELLQKLLLEKYDVYISFPKGITQTKELIEMGCKFINTNIKRRGMNPLDDLKLLYEYINIINKLKPDKVLTYTIKPNIYGGLACSFKKAPYVATITGLGTAVENKGVLQSVLLLLYRFALKKSSCVFFQNEQNRDFFISKNIIKNNYILVNGSGVNLDKFRILDYPQKTNFFFIARIMKTKGIDEYLQAAEHIKKTYKDVNFHIVGFCEEDYQKVIKKMSDSKIVIYHGQCDNIPELQKINSCTILPSYHEGMSNVLLESCACARPCLCSDIPGCREIIENEKNGFLFESKNTQSLISAIENFLLLPYEERKRMGLYGRKKIEKDFNREDIVKKYIEKITEA